MLLIHENTVRGRTTMGWLDSHHTFSFGGFKDPMRMGVGPLRVINDDRVIPGSGFSAHEHASMDILTYVLKGALRHEDSIGNISTITAGEVQLMSAGSGITHSEWNASEEETAHFLQIWLIPDAPGGTPTYQQRPLPVAPGMVHVAGGDGTDGAFALRSGAQVYRVTPAEGEVTSLPQPADAQATGRHGFVHIIEGLAEVEGERLRPGDALQASGEVLPDLTWLTPGEALYFDLPRHHG